MNWKSPGQTPDELVYEQNAERAKIGFLWSVRVGMRVYCDHPELSAFPSPLRWLWTWVTRWVGVERMSGAPWLVVPFALLPFMNIPRSVSNWEMLKAEAPLVLLCFACPLLLWSCRRRLQDSVVALVTCIAVALAYHGHPIGAAVACVALLCIKEAGVLMLPAVVVANHMGVIHGGSGWIELLPLASVPVWLLLTRLVCGPLTWQAFRIARQGHHTPYTAQHQSGMPHRLFVDLMLVSPLPVLLALISRSPLAAIAFTIVIAHTLAPVRNVRTVLAADLLIRAACAGFLASHGWAGVATAVVMVAYDLWVSSRLRGLRDTPTHALAQSIGAVP